MACSKTELLLEYSRAAKAAHATLFDCKDSIDLVVTAGDSQFPCHKFLLSAWSGYFRRMFDHDWKEANEGHVILQESETFSPEAFAALHSWMYKGELDLSVTALRAILPTAHYLQMDCLVDTCLKVTVKCYAEGTIKMPEVTEDLDIARKYGFSQLGEAAIRFIARNFDAAAKIGGILKLLPHGEFLAVLQHEQLTTQREEIIFQAAILWLEQEESRLDYLEQVLGLIRLGLVPAPIIRAAMTPSLMAKSQEGFDLLLDAITRDIDPLSRQRLPTSQHNTFSCRHVAAAEPSSPVIPTLSALYGKTVMAVYAGYSEVTPDIRVIVHNHVFSCHKPVLTGWSGYFRRVISSGSGDTGQVSLEGETVSVEGFKVLRGWIYDGDLAVTPDNLCEVYVTARCLQMDGVVSLLDTYCSKRLAPVIDTVQGPQLVHLLNQASKYKMTDIYDVAIDGILRNFDELCLTPDFLDGMPLDAMLTVLAHDELAASSEDVVFLAALAWLRRDETRLEHVRDIVTSVRLGLVEVSTLCDHMDFSLIVHAQECWRLVLCATGRTSDSRRLKAMRTEYPILFKPRDSKWTKVIFYGEQQRRGQVYGRLLDVSSGIPHRIGVNNGAVTSLFPVGVIAYSVTSQRLYTYDKSRGQFVVDGSPMNLDRILCSEDGCLLIAKTWCNTRGLDVVRFHQFSGVWEEALTVSVDEVLKAVNPAQDIAGSPLSVRCHGGCLVKNNLVLALSCQRSDRQPLRSAYGSVAVEKYFWFESVVTGSKITRVTAFPPFLNPVASLNMISWRGDVFTLAALNTGRRSACRYISGESGNVLEELSQEVVPQNANRVWSLGEEVLFVGDNGGVIPICAPLVKALSTADTLTLAAKWTTAGAVPITSMTSCLSMNVFA